MPVAMAALLMVHRLPLRRSRGTSEEPSGRGRAAGAARGLGEGLRRKSLAVWFPAGAVVLG